MTTDPLIVPLTYPVGITIARAITNDCNYSIRYYTGHHHLMGGDAPYQDHQRDWYLSIGISGRGYSISGSRHSPDDGIFINITTNGFI